MGSNTFGNIFKITTWGESHGRAIGVVIDGCPAGLELSEDDIHADLMRRRPGKRYTSLRKENDAPEILSGVFEGKTTGTPISIIIYNEDASSKAYTPIKHLLRPGHANFTYLKKYGIFDFRGGGRASARETACRVAAGAVAKKILKHFGIKILAYLKEAGGIVVPTVNTEEFDLLCTKILNSPIFCPDPDSAQAIMHKIEAFEQEGDSLGGVVEFVSVALPAGLGDPIYEKLEANFAKAMLTLPASKGIEIGSGFMAAKMKGSEHNDLFTVDSQGAVTTETNWSGGTLGGISSGMPLIVRVAFKPTSSIAKTQKTLNLCHEPAALSLPEGSRHDPCLVLRAVPVVEAMGALVLVDTLLMNRSARL